MGQKAPTAEVSVNTSCFNHNMEFDMKIEIGKIYKTRDGRKAFIYWDDNGRFIPDEERPEDLTGEWE